jgi:hypothetical protein
VRLLGIYALGLSWAILSILSDASHQPWPISSASSPAPEGGWGLSVSEVVGELHLWLDQMAKDFGAYRDTALLKVKCEIS